MSVQMNNISKLIVLYWRHSTEDRENSWTKEFYEKLIYDDNIDIRYRPNMEFVFANTNRLTESYLANKEIVERLRRYKTQGQPLVFLELKFDNEQNSREEMISIDNEGDMNRALARIKYYLNVFEK